MSDQEKTTDSVPSTGLAGAAGSGLRVIEGTPRVPRDFCVVCGKPWANTLQHGQRACSDECCEIIINGERMKEKRSNGYLDPADPADNITLNNFFL